MVILLIGHRVFQSNPDILLGDLTEVCQNIVFTIGKDDISTGKELQEHMVHAIAEGEVDNAVRPDLLDRGHPARFQGFAESRHELRRRGCGRPRVLGDMAAETRVDDELSAVVRFCELE